MKRLLLTALFLVAACLPPPGAEVQGGEGNGRWSYGEGPNGEKCLFYTEGFGNTSVMSMHCDSVNTPASP